LAGLLAFLWFSSLSPNESQDRIYFEIGLALQGELLKRYR
jgi:hypothetical protein